MGGAHFGGYMAFDESVEYLCGNERVWFDTSSALWAITPEYANSLIKKLGTSRLMFGTDYPVKYPYTELPRFDRLALTEKEREDVLYNNAKTFLSLYGTTDK